MANMVTGFFRTLAHAEHTKSELANFKNIPTIHMQVYDHPGVQPIALTDSSASGLFGSLKDFLGFGHSSQALCPEGIRRGGPILEVQAEHSHIDAIANMLDRCGAEDISIFTAAERIDRHEE
ncbi:MAG: hypothetical protein NDI90_05825 [Nitrospira sp. BO4]|nr:hypothetical protein [Nitrospira sp. BO4]